MTPFQQRSLAILTHAYINELKRYSNDKITGRYVDVTYKDNNAKLVIIIRELSWFSIELQEADGNKFKFFDEAMEKGSIRIKSEDNPYEPIYLYDLTPNSIRGKDWEGNWFEGTVEGYRRVKLRAGSKQRDYLYDLRW